MTRWLDEKHKIWISRNHGDWTYRDLEKHFKEKFGFTISKSTIIRYKDYSIPKEEKEKEEGKEIEMKEEEKEEEVELEKEGKKEVTEISVKDTRKQKPEEKPEAGKKQNGSWRDISDGQLDNDDFMVLCQTIGRDEATTWSILKQALRRGYTKVNIETGEVKR